MKIEIDVQSTLQQIDINDCVQVYGFESTDGNIGKEFAATVELDDDKLKRKIATAILSDLSDRIFEKLGIERKDEDGGIVGFEGGF